MVHAFINYSKTLLTPLFLLMFAISTLININFTVLRSIRNTLTVADLGGSAALLPYFELLGAAPGAILITAFITWLIGKYPLQKVFCYTMALFLGFYATFAFAIYPFLAGLKQQLLSLPHFPLQAILAEYLVPFVSMMFYAMAELWKVAIYSVLFCALINQYLSLSEAKKYYAPLTLGTSIGAMLAGSVIATCTSETTASLLSINQMAWKHSFYLLITAICIIGCITALLFYQLWRKLSIQKPTTFLNTEQSSFHKKNLSLRECISTCWRSPYLLLMAIIVSGDYIAYSLGEVIILDVFKLHYPDPKQYCQFMGKLSTWGGALTFVSALFIAPWLFARFRWVVSSVVTPVCLLLTGGPFIIAVCFKDSWPVSLEAAGIHWLALCVLFGAAQFVLCRSTKYTLFDSSKELAFVHLASDEKIKGKLVIDGICSRLGKGSSSLLSILLIRLFGSPIGSALLTGVISMTFTLAWIGATFRLGKMVDGKGLQPAHDSA